MVLHPALLAHPNTPRASKSVLLREILDAVFYVVRSGCAWRLLRLRTPWKTVYHYVRGWRIDCTWKKMHATFRIRVQVGYDFPFGMHACYRPHTVHNTL